MNILYGVQGTGRGHLSRAQTFLPLLKKYADVDVLISGSGEHSDDLNNIVYRKRGASLNYTINGKVSLRKTARNLKPLRFLSDILSIPINNYDLVISDFEPISAWAARRAGVRCVAMSHQAAFLSPRTPRDWSYNSVVAEPLMRYFTPADHAIGFHYRRYDDFIEPPLIRNEIRSLNPKKGPHYTVYLPAIDIDRVSLILRKTGIKIWHVFTPEVTEPEWSENILLHPTDNNFFLKSISSAEGVLTHAGFETTSEAMYLNKKLFVIPIGNQYEQFCNEKALRKLGAWSRSTFDQQLVSDLRQWIKSGNFLTLREIAEPLKITKKIIDQHNTSSSLVA